jgi:hypothetical protein
MNLLLTIREVDDYVYEEKIKFLEKLKIEKKSVEESYIN